jgi:endonuclease-3
LKLKQRLGEFSMPALSGLAEADLVKVMTEPEPLHRFAKRMAGFIYAAIQQIADVNNGGMDRSGTGCF